MTTDAAFVALTSAEQVVVVFKQQVDQLRAADYGHSKPLTSDVIVHTSALYRGAFSRQRRDGSEIGRLSAT